MNKGIRFAIIVFIVWVSAPLILSVLVFFTNKEFLEPLYLINIIVPGLFFSLISNGLFKIKDDKLRRGLSFAYIGTIVWVSPTIYFLRASIFFANLSLNQQTYIVLIPATTLAILLLYLGYQTTENNNIEKLYLKKAYIQKNLD